VAKAEAAIKGLYRGRTKAEKEKRDKALAGLNKLLKTHSSGNLSLARNIDARPEVRRGHEFEEKFGKKQVDADDLL
jgi:hypothetical protein